MTHDESYVGRFSFTKPLKRDFQSSTTDGSQNVVWSHGESKGQSEPGMLRMLWDVFLPGDVMLAERVQSGIIHARGDVRGHLDIVQYTVATTGL